MRRAPVIGYVVCAVLFLGASAWLGRLERAGPTHFEVELDGRVPATFYHPGAADVRREIRPAREDRPPAVVLTHGRFGDRAMMSALARRLASNGYAVLALDHRGHGQNPNPVPHGSGAEALSGDVESAVEYARRSPFVDGSRIALVGHGVGGAAAFDYATRDSGLDAVVPISSRSRLLGPYRPPNVLVIWGQRDAAGIAAHSRALAAELSGDARPALATTYGDLAQGTGVRAREIAGAGHLSILYSEEAAEQIIGWLDAVFGVRRAGPAALREPRLVTLLLALALVVVVFAAIGGVVGRLAPPWPERPSAGGGLGLLGLFAGLLATLPLLATHAPAAFLSLYAGDVVVGHLSLAGVLLLVALALGGGLDAEKLLGGIARTLTAGGLGALALYAVTTPLGAVLHRLALTAERMLLAALGSALLLPFFLALELLLRRGGVRRAALLATAGRLLVVATLLAGVSVGALPGSIAPLLGALLATLVLTEVVASAIYAASRNLAAIAVVESAWIAAVFAALLPVRF